MSAKRKATAIMQHHKVSRPIVTVSPRDRTFSATRVCNAILDVAQRYSKKLLRVKV